MTSDREIRALRRLLAALDREHLLCLRTGNMDKLPGISFAMALIDAELKEYEHLQKLTS